MPSLLVLRASCVYSAAGGWLLRTPRPLFYRDKGEQICPSNKMNSRVEIGKLFFFLS